MSLLSPDCDATCERESVCATCGTIKAPIGRSLPLGMYRCDSDCKGYRDDPYPPHLWPNETAALKEEK